MSPTCSRHAELKFCLLLSAALVVTYSVIDSRKNKVSPKCLMCCKSFYCFVIAKLLIISLREKENNTKNCIIVREGRENLVLRGESVSCEKAFQSNIKA